FQMEHSAETIDDVRTQFEDHRFGAIYEGEQMAEGNRTLFRTLLENAVEFQGPIDQMTDRALVEKWPLKRIDPTLRALFRAAGAELTKSNTPPKVVINEYV
ncbi:antitermination protein NusB, partial [Marinosulfonomonas sp. PRT-SC04]